MDAPGANPTGVPNVPGHFPPPGEWEGEGRGGEGEGRDGEGRGRGG